MYKYMGGNAPIVNNFGFFYGFGYTTLSIPIEFEAMVTPGGRENQVYATPFFDPNFKSSYYTLLFGYDMLRQLCLSGGRFGLLSSPAPRFGMYASNNNKFGLGPGTLSDIGINNAHAQNPGYTLAKTKSLMIWDGMNFTKGFRYYYANRKFFLLAAVGYDLELFILSEIGSFAETNTDLGYDCDPFILDHGFSFKVCIAYNRDWK